MFSSNIVSGTDAVDIVYGGFLAGFLLWMRLRRKKSETVWARVTQELELDRSADNPLIFRRRSDDHEVTIEQLLSDNGPVWCSISVRAPQLPPDLELAPGAVFDDCVRRPGDQLAVAALSLESRAAYLRAAQLGAYVSKGRVTIPKADADQLPFALSVLRAAASMLSISEEQLEPRALAVFASARGEEALAIYRDLRLRFHGAFAQRRIEIGLEHRSPEVRPHAALDSGQDQLHVVQNVLLAQDAPPVTRRRALEILAREQRLPDRELLAPIFRWASCAELNLLIHTFSMTDQAWLETQLLSVVEYTTSDETRFRAIEALETYGSRAALSVLREAVARSWVADETRRALEKTIAAIIAAAEHSVGRERCRWWSPRMRAGRWRSPRRTAHRRTLRATSTIDAQSQESRRARCR